MHVLGFLQTTAEWSVGLQPKPLGEGVARHDPGSSMLEVQSDSDWAGCHKTRRSTSANTIFWAGMLVHSASRAQKSVTLSSTEAEINSAVTAAAEGIYVLSCLRHVTCINLAIDNSAARCILSRSGVGRIRHLQGKNLWIQERVSNKTVCIFPVFNPLKHERRRHQKFKVGTRDLFVRPFGLEGWKRAVSRTARTSKHQSCDQQDQQDQQQSTRSIPRATACRGHVLCHACTCTPANERPRSADRPARATRIRG